MNTKHTPGPWEAVDRLTVRSAYVMGDRSKAGWEVARLPESALAGDSALISAAPDLLAALRDVVGYAVTEVTFCAGRKCREPHCCDCNGEEYAESYVSRSAESIAAARAAIAKAEGRA